MATETVYKQFTAQDKATIPFNAYKQYDYKKTCTCVRIHTLFVGNSEFWLGAQYKYNIINI